MRVAIRLSPLLFCLAVACKDKAQPDSTHATTAVTSAPAAAAPGTARIGAALSLTGPAASYGAQQRAGILAAVEEINQAGGLKLEVLIEDDSSVKEQGINV